MILIPSCRSVFAVAGLLLSFSLTDSPTGSDARLNGLSPSSINVKDHGAIGDGVADDTQAIQAAVNAASEVGKTGVLKARHWNHLISGINILPCAEVVFPPGEYRITETIVLPRQAYLRGMDRALIVQSDPEKDAFYFHANLHAVVEGLAFKGGRIQLRFWTNNLGGAEVRVNDCHFADAKGYAIECQSYTQEKLKGEDSELNSVKPWPPYDLQWNNGRPTLLANNAEHLKEWFNSTLLSISNSEFTNCVGAADLQCDTAIIQNSRIDGSPETNGPILNLPSGKTHLYKIKGTARLNPVKDAYWVEGGGILSVRDVELDTDSPSGLDFVRVSHVANPISLAIGGFCVEIENSRLKVGGSRHGAICWLSQGNQPSIFSLIGVTETSGKPVKAIAWETTPDAASLEKLIPPNNPLVPADWFKIQLSENSPNIDPNLSGVMESLLQVPVPKDAMSQTFVPELSWNYADLEKGATRTIHAEDFGLQSSSEADQSEVVQKIFDAVDAQSESLIIFPPGIFRVSETIQLPKRVIVKAAGRAIFLSLNPEKDMFMAKDAEKIAFKDMIFSGGRNALDLHCPAETEARVAFADCSFVDQRGVALRCLAGSGAAGEKNSAQLAMSGGTFSTMQSLVTNASRAQIDGMWIINDPHLHERAAIENLGGDMRLQANLANPTLWEGKRHKRPASFETWDYSRDTRWIDNLGRLYGVDNRFGGESGGMANVFNRSESATVFLGGGTTRFHNGFTTKAIVYFEKEPSMAVLRNISSVPVSVEGSSAVLHAPGAFNAGKLFMAGVMAPLSRELATGDQ